MMGDGCGVRGAGCGMRGASPVINLFGVIFTARPCLTVVILL